MPPSAFVAPDAAERLRALDPLSSFIVQAPAGSGKTELLIQRYLALLARVERPEEIVAITFTRKAAAEMRSRILDALATARAGEAPQAPHEATTCKLARAALEANDRFGWRLQENAARLRVQTIDALCVSLTRRMPLTARFGAQPESIDDATLHYFEAARNLLAAVEDPEDPCAPDIAHLLAHLDNRAEEALGLIANMLETRDHWIHNLAFDRDRASLEAALVDVRLAAAARCRSLHPEGPETIEEWIELARELLTARERKWRSRSPLAQKLKSNEALRVALCEALDAPPPCYTEAQWAALGAITRLLPRAVAELKLVFAAHGQCDFVEVAQGALAALEGEDGPTNLMLALDYRIRHILVDEFQDTSQTQFRLLEKLTEGWEPGDGRTLFVVGDPMQSIYRFRQAEVSLFLDARHSGIGSVKLEPLVLRANFRSQPAIVSWVNSTFARVLAAEEDIAAGAVAYSPSVAIPGEAGPDVKVHAFFDRDREAEAARVVELVRSARAAQPGGTVAILVRNRAHLEEIVPRLRSAGLRFRAVEIEPLAGRPVVLDLLALARALSHLADRTAWLSVLRAPWCGLRLADLCALAGKETVWEAIHDEARLAALTDEGRVRLAHTRTVLARSLDERLRSTLRDAVEGAWLALGGPACVEAATDLEDAEIFLDFLEANEVAGALVDPASFERRLQKLYAVPDLEADESLQVMTVHKAKGLEFDTVILPGLGSGAGRDERKLFLWLKRRAAAARLLVAPINSTGTEKDPIYDHIRKLDRRHADHESGRLLYVAATRARSALHLCGDARVNDDGEAEARTGSLLQRLWPAVHDAFVAPAALARRQAGAARANGTQWLRRLQKIGVEVSLPAVGAWQPPPEETDAALEIEFSWAGETARRIGTVVHRWMQRIAEEGLERWNADTVAALVPVYRANLAALGVAGSQLEAAARSVERSLRNALEDPRGRWVLGAHPVAHTEYRLTSFDGRVRRSFVVDRHFVAADGVRWIVDYKTSRHEGADPEAFLDRERERYRGQLLRYGALFEDASKQGLYFPLMPAWREL